MGSLRLLLSVVIAVAFGAAVLAGYVPYPNRHDICVFACYDWTDHVTWELPPALADSEDYYLVLCTTRIKYGSIFACAQEYCSEGDRRHGLKLLNRTCQVEAGLNLPSIENLALTPGELAQIPRITESEEGASVDTISIPDAPWISLSHRTDVAFYTNIWFSFDFAYAFYGYWALVILVGMTFRATELFTFHRRQEVRLWTWVRRRLLLPAMFGRHCQEPIFGGTIPPRLESLTLAVFVVMNFIMCFPGYYLFDDNQYFETRSIQLSRYVADRTGILSIALLPMVWIFSARNDPLLWLTGWSFATFNRFHRWLARLSFVHAVIHSVAYSANYAYTPNEYEDAWAEPYWYYGQIATIIMALSVCTSIWWIREKSYDLFLPTHIALAVVFLVMLWYHVAIEFYDQYKPFLWPCIAIWVLDRALRLARVVHSSIIPRCTKGIKAIATYDQRSQMIRLDVTDYLKDRGTVSPGLYYYIYNLGSLKAYESHPFTLCSWQKDAAPSESNTSQAERIDEKGLHQPDPDIVNAPRPSTCHSFLIRPYNGFTNRLRTKLSTSEIETLSLLIEGPYGNTIDLSAYSNILLIAGGSGITAAISHIYHLPSTSAIHLIWAVPQRHLVDDVFRNELAAISGHSNFQADVYLTSGAEEDPEKPDGVPPYAVRFGRPDILDVMRRARTECKGDLAIVTCGTPQMADDCRKSVVKLLEEEGPRVGYFNETMLW